MQSATQSATQNVTAESFLNLHEIVAVPFGKFTNCLQTKEFTQLEPGNVEHKFYARGVGFILGVVVKGGKERLALVNIVREP